MEDCGFGSKPKLDECSRKSNKKPSSGLKRMEVVSVSLTVDKNRRNVCKGCPAYGSKGTFCLSQSRSQSNTNGAQCVNTPPNRVSSL